MEILIELLLDLILEGSLELSSNRKVPKFIRYPLIILLILFFISVIGLIFYLGIMIIHQNKLAGLFIIGVSLTMFILCIYKFKKIYIIKNSDTEKQDNVKS